MSDRDALYAAILAHPDEDTPRLVFADWLEENDQPHWAALIRTECARERLRDDGSAAEAFISFLGHIEAQGGCAKIAERVRWDRAEPDVGARLAHEAPVGRLRRQSARIRNAGRPPATKCGLSWSGHTHRGLQAAATVLEGDRFAKHFDAVTHWCPPVELTVDSANVHSLPSVLVARGLLKWVRALNLTDDVGLCLALTQDPNAGDVRSLTCRSNVGDMAEMFVATASSPHWSGLRALDISENEVVGDVAEKLFQAPNMSRLNCLHLYSGDWTAETMDMLLQAPLHNLRELMLRFGTLDDDAVEKLAGSPVLGNLQYLDLSHNRITARGATALLTSKHLKNLTILELERNPIQNLDRVALAAAPTGGLRAISFHGCQLGSLDVAALAACPRLAELVYLDLDFNNLPNDAISLLVERLPCVPAIVYLMGNRITTGGVKALAAWAGKPGVDQLHLCRNPLKAPAAAALAASPQLEGLRHLCVSGLSATDRKVLDKRFQKRVEYPS